MQITSDSRRKKRETLESAHPGALFIDVTSKGAEPWVRLSPFFPHGGIPVPFSSETSMSVEGVWQGLKVFESAGIDTSKFAVSTMKGIKRSVRKNGRCLGHQRGVQGNDLLSYERARWEIYLPTYRYLLAVAAAEVVDQLRVLSRERPVVLLDYETNADIRDLRRPLSHAALVVRFLLDDWPKQDAV